MHTPQSQTIDTRPPSPTISLSLSLCRLQGAPTLPLPEMQLIPPNLL